MFKAVVRAGDCWPGGRCRQASLFQGPLPKVEEGEGLSLQKAEADDQALCLEQASGGGFGKRGSYVVNYSL